MSTSVHKVTATEAKNRFGTILRKAYADADHVIIERDGIPVAAIVPIQDYEQIADQPQLAIHAEGSASRDRLKAFLERMEAKMPHYPEEQVEADIREAIRAVRAANQTKKAATDESRS